MNKQYKVIWSKVRHCYVVVSELAKRNGKTKSVKAQSCQKLAVTLTVLALSLGVTGVVGAANNTAGSGSGVAVGSGSSASNAASVAIGAGATANVSDGVALGSGSVANVALGFGYLPLYTSFEGNEYFSPAWRSSWGAVSVGVTDSSGVATKTRQIVGVAAGYQDTDAVNVAQLKKLDSKIEKHRVHYFAVSTSDLDNTDNVNALGTDSMAIGPSARANSERGLAIGKSAKVYSVDGVALGSNSYNIVTSNIRGYIPTSVTLTEEQQTTPTWRATMGAVAIGITAEDSTGAITTATGTRQIAGLAAGTQDTDAVNVAQLKAVNDKVDANKIKYVSIKQVSAGTADNENNDGATGDDATAIGVFASATGANSTALGVKSQAAAANAIALGDFAAANGIGSVAAGDYAEAGSHGAIAVGSEAKATGMQSIALGDEAKGTGYQATVVGGEAAASGINSLAVGFGSNAKGQFGSAFGGEAAADGDFATAAGYGANATANSSTALGENSAASIEGGVALGSYSKTTVNSGVLGYDPSDKITTQEILLGDNKDTYDSLQSEITTARSNVSSLAQQILDLQTEYDTANDTRRAKIINEIKSLNTQFLAARSDLQDKESAANKLVSTWQAIGAAVSVGNSETGLTRQITNVAAGAEATDAVNVAQLSALNDKVDEGWTLAIARGSDSKTENDATVEGDSKQINVGDTVTLQAGRGIKLKQDEAAVQIGLKYLDVEPKGDTYNDATASGEGALAIGQNSVASGQQGTAVGYAAQATGKSSFAGGTNAIAGGGNSVAIGTNAITTVQESIAIGKGKGNDTDGYKKVDSGFSVAIGSSAVVGENSASSVAIGGSAQVTNSSGATALGSKAKVTESISGTAIGSSAEVSGSRNGTAIGKSAKVENAEDAVALGSQSVANRAKGTVGYDVTGTDHSNDAAGTWKSGLGAVSVGSQRSGNTRQIINVAAGSEDTDAVNVAQLKAAGTAGLNFKGDGDTVVHRDLGATLNVVGGNTDADSLTDNNIGVVADNTTGTLNVKLAKNLTMGDGSITFAPTGAKDAEGNVLVQGQDGKWYSDLTDATYDATSNIYTKADGTKVDAVENPVVSAVKLTDKGLDNGGNKITNVADGTADTDIVNVKQLKGSTIKSSDVMYADNGSGTITLTMQDGSKVTIDSLKDTYVKEGKLENNTLKFTRNDNTSFEVGDIASKSEMDKAVGAANLKFTGDNTEEDAAITKKNGETLNILGGASEFTTANNIGVVKDGEALKVKLAKNVSMGDGSVTFANAKDASGNTLVQGQDGKWYSDLTGATYDATNNVYTKADGTKVDAAENPVVSAVTLSNTGLDNGGNKITNVAAGTVDTDIVNLGQLKGSTIASSDVTYGADGSGTITLTMQDGSKVTIDKLKDTYVKEGKLENNKLTFTRNDDTSFEVGDIASKSEMDTAVKDANLKFTGDNTDEDATITRKNGETLSVLGGASEFTAANNIGVVKDGEALRVKLAKDVAMGNGSVTFTNAKDASGNTLVQGQDGKWYSDLTGATYDATNNVYTKADGTTVSAVENPVVSAVKLTNEGLDNGGNKITNVAAGTEDTDIVNLKQLKGSTIESSKLEYTDAGVGTMTLTMQDGSKVEIGGLQDKYIKGASLDGNKLTITRNDDQKFEVDNIATTADIVGENSKVNLKFTGDDTSEDGTITKINGATLNILGGAKDFTATNNIGVVKDGEALRVKLAKDVSMGNGSVTFANAKDASGNTLVQGQDGKWYSDLTDAIYDATNNVYTKADGTTVSAVENPVVSQVKLSDTGLDNGGNKITNVAAGTEDTDIVNLKQLKGSTIESSKLEYTDAGVGTMTLTMQDGSKVEIGGLQDKYIKGASLDGNKLTITRNDDQKFEVDNIATTADIVGENSKVNMKFTGDDTSEDGTITKINGATLNVLGGASEFTTANNIGVVKDGDALRVKLAKDVSLGNGSITFAPTGAKDAEGNALVQGQDGKWYSDLTDATYDATNNVYTKDGTTVSAVENPVVSQVKLSDTGLDNGGNKITNVAAGTEDTDIVNVKQLKGSTIKSSELKYTDAGVGTMTLTMQDGSKVEIGGLQDKYVTGASLDGNKLTITRNDNEKFEVDKIATTDDIVGENSKVNMKFTGDDTSEDGTITKINGATLNVLGGASEFTTANNIGVVKDGDALRVKLAKDVSMGNGSVTFANAKDASGNTLVQGQDGKWYSDLTDATYDATNNVYTKADGTTVSAVENPTVSEVKLSNTGLDNGGNKITNVADGTADTDIVNVKQLKGSTIKSSDVTYADNGSGTITLTMQDGSKVTIDNLKDTYVKEGKLENNKLTFTRNDDTSFEVGDIASKSEMDTAVKDVNLKFTGDNTDEDATITRKNGETLSVLGGAKEFTAADNIGVVADTDKGTLNVKLAKNISMGDGSITFAPTGAKDAEGNALVQGQDGKWYSDLSDATYDATNNVYTKSDGTTVSAVENPTVSEVKLSNTGLDNGGNKITNVAAGTEDTDIVNLGQLKGSTIKSSDVTYATDGSGTITLTMQDGSKVKIDSLKDTYVSKAKFENNKLTFTRNDDTSFEVGDIASKSEMDTAVKDANLKFTGDDTSDDATITKKNGETLTIYGGVAAKDDDGNSLLTDVNNVGVVKTENGLQIKLAKNLSGIDSARIGVIVTNGVATGGIYIANQSVTYNGSAKKTESGLYITGLANTSWNPTTDGIVSGRAATEDQLKAAYDGLSSTIADNKVVAGKNIVVTELKNGAGTEVALSDDLSFGTENGNNVAIKGNEGIISAGDGGSNKVVVDGTKSTVTAGTGDNTVKVDGSNGQVTIGDGSNGTIVMGNQEFTVKNADGTDKTDEDGNVVKQSGKYITGLDNTSWDKANVVETRAATEGQLKDIVGQFDGKIDDINNAKRSFNSDTGEVIKRGKDDVLDIKGGAKGELSDGNIGVVNNTGATGFDVKLAKDLKNLNSVTSNTVTTKELTVSEKANIGNVSISNDNVTIGTGDSKTVITNETVTTGSVTTGNTTINNDGLTIKNEDSSKNITVQNNNVSMGGNVVHNVGDGVEATDAINKGQFDRTVNAIGTGMNQMSNRISKLDTRVDRVGAGAAALAALHPLEYNADEKWEISAGVGNYRGANAVAVGAFYRPNGNTLVSLGTSYGGGENMVNAGVTWRVGEGETGNYSSKQAMAQEISSLKSVVSDQSSQLQAQNSKIEAQSQQLEEQNKKIEQLMQAIAELKK